MTRAGDVDRRERILSVAAGLLARSGYAGTSLADIAEACGILPGSLYHHFDSKEAIAIELLERYRSELKDIERLGKKLLDGAGTTSAYDQIIAVCSALASTAARSRAALQLTLYEPHSGASTRLRTRAEHISNIEPVVAEILRRGSASGAVDRDINVEILSDQMCEDMRRVGRSLFYPESLLPKVINTVCHILLDGLTDGSVTNSKLDRSPAMQAANKTIKDLGDPEENGANNYVLVRRVARAEFARRGYHATTMRDIAAAAGISTGRIYRYAESKEALLTSISDPFNARLTTAYEQVMESASSPIEKLDALTWVNINFVDKAWQEFLIQRSWLHGANPDPKSIGIMHTKRAQHVLELVVEGLRSDQWNPQHRDSDSLPVDVLAMCVRDLIWIPHVVVQKLGDRGALGHARATILRGASSVARRA